MKPARRLSISCGARRAIAFGVGGSIFALSTLPSANPQQQPRWPWQQQAPVRAVPLRRPPAPPTPKPTPKVFVALPNYDEETATRLQIFLDNSDFGPGKIDGRMGEFFRKALVSYKHARAMPITGVVDQWMLDQVPQTFTTYTIKGDDLAFVGNLPSAHEEQAKLKFLPYTSLLEFVAERYHSAETFIQKLNPGMDWEHLEPGDELKVPNVLPFEIEKVKEQQLKPNPKFAARFSYVGTRYCGNNCPYHVRRFNWFQYEFPAPLDVQLNPDVTVRQLGVMEKCTMCLQRIIAGKDRARDEKRAVRDGDIQTACQQTCPTQAITFGNLKDEGSAVTKLTHSPRAYHVLEEVGTRPSITYLRKVVRGPHA